MLTAERTKKNGHVQYRPNLILHNIALCMTHQHVARKSRQEYRMPQYFDSEIPYTRRDCHKDLKIYRNKQQLHGPNLISKYVWFDDSHPTFFKFIEDDGSLKSEGKMMPYPSIAAANTILYEGFDVCYSSNKRRRWTLIDQLSESLYSLQNPSIGLRVSLLRVKTDLRNGDYDRPEFLRDFTADTAVLIDFRGFNGDNELYIKRRNATFGDVYRRKRRPEIMHIQTEEERNRSRTVPFNERKTHVIIKEQISTTSARHVNMDEGLIIRRTNSSVKRSRKRKQKREHRKQRRASKHPTLSKIGKKAASSIIPCTADWNVEPLDSTDNEEIARSGRPMMSANFCDLVMIKVSCKRAKKRNKPKICTSVEYNVWLHSCSNTTRDTHNATENNVIELEIEEGSSSFPTLDTFLIPVGRHEVFAPAVKQWFPHCQLVENIYPDSFLCEINEDQRVPSILSSNLQAFDGVIVLQDVTVASGEKFIRCILNRRSPKENTNNEDDEEAVAYSTRSKVSQIKWNCLMPSECIAKTKCYSRKQAESIALSYAIERFRSYALKQTEIDLASSSGSERSHCRICDKENDDNFALGCQHFFCRECWAHYTYLQIEEARAPISCIKYKCNGFMQPEHMRIILPIALCDRYERLLRDTQLVRSEWIYCIRCTRVVHLESVIDNGRVVVVCECGTAMCIKCGQRVHMPLSCADARFYLNTLEINGRDFHVANDERSVMVKQCPDCGLFCERIDGCNHMECPCGADFCYICGRTFYEQRVNHYDCTADVTVRVDLLDVPRVAFNKLSLTVFEQCLQLRQARGGQQLHAFRRNLMRILRHDDDEVNRILQLYCAACESLELGILGSHLLRRQLRHIRDHRMLTKIAMMMSSLNTSLTRLRFYVHFLTRNSATTTTRRSDLISFTKNVHSALRDYLIEASKQMKAPVLTTI
ncbi:unnamed protein product [Toxocara canis]|uniref:RBR-type E3 ubiquitin transferase n=1 Tax=Toxocara canis TaxID=6265 RepID=A0A183V8W2_TOXCA|nr:unnamed protein product [Toxocara canis]